MSVYAPEHTQKKLWGFGFNKKIVPNEFFDGFKYRQSEKSALVLLEKLFDADYSCYRHQEIEILRCKGTTEFLYARVLSSEISNIIANLEFARDVERSNNIRVFSFFGNFSPGVYKKVIELRPDLKAVRLFPGLIFLQNVWLVLSSVLLLFYLFGAPILLAFYSGLTCFRRFWRDSSVGKLDTCVVADRSLLDSHVAPDKILQSLAKVDRSSIIFLNDSISPRLVMKKEKVVGPCSYTNIYDLTSKITATNLVKIWRDTLKIQVDLVALLFNCGCGHKIIAKEFHNYLLWNLFFKVYSVKKVLTFMVKDSLVASAIQKNEGVGSFFLYLSSSEKITHRYDHALEVVELDYCFMSFDCCIGSFISNERARGFPNKIGMFIDTLPIGPQMLKTKKKLLVSAHEKKQMVVSFFDVKAGFQGMVSEVEYIRFIECVQDFAIQNPDIAVVLKIKGIIRFMTSSFEAKRAELLNKIKALSNVKQMDSRNVSQFDIMQFSDVVITQPCSSIFFEAASLSVPVLIFDPFCRYRDYSCYTVDNYRWWASSIQEINSFVADCSHGQRKKIIKKDIARVRHDIHRSAKGLCLDGLFLNNKG
jgi:hypothetical protein